MSCGGADGDANGDVTTEQADEQALAAGANLTVESISLTAYCGFFGCSVVFHNTVCNRGTVPVYGSGLASRWGGPGSIYSSCSGTWDAQNTFGTINPGVCLDVITYGPGYVGPKISKGSSIGVTSMVDVYCRLAETNESDNTRSARLPVN